MNGRTFDESGDPLISAAAFELLQHLIRKGVVADEIRIRFSRSSDVPAHTTTVTIELPSMAEPPEILPDFEGLHGVYALIDVEEEEKAL